MIKHDLQTLAILDAIGQEMKCPLCHLWEKDEEREIRHLLSSEVVMDPGFREKLLLAKGFCGYHSHKLFKAVSGPFQGDDLGLALYFQGVVDVLLEELSSKPADALEASKTGVLASRARKKRQNFSALSVQVAKVLQGKQACPACKSLESSDRMHLKTLLRMLDDGDFRAYFQSSPGLCLPHFASALRLLSQTTLANSKAVAAVIIEVEMSRLQDVGSLLSRFVRKQSYEFANESPGEEVQANRLALNALVGTEGLCCRSLKAPTS